MAFRLRVDGGPTVNAGLVALWFYRGSGPVLLRNPIFLCFFRGRGPVPLPPPPSGSAHVKHFMFHITSHEQVRSKYVWCFWAMQVPCFLVFVLMLNIAPAGGESLKLDEEWEIYSLTTDQQIAISCTPVKDIWDFYPGIENLILHMLSYPGCHVRATYIGCIGTHAHGRQVTSLLC